MKGPGSRNIRRLVRRLRRRFTVRGVILMYHRIADLDCDPWGLAVSPAHFAAHVGVLRSRQSTIALPRLVEAAGTGEAPRRPIVVTFDDGYADNVEIAAPLLERDDIPATVFLTTGAIGSHREFWWDELERALLEPRDLPPAIDLRRDGWRYRRDLGADATYDEGAFLRHRSWRAWEKPPTVRHAIYDEVWRHLYPLPHDQQRALLDDLLDWAGLEPLMRPTHRLVSRDQAAQLGRSPVIEIGAHTVTHPALPHLALSSQAEEIEQSKQVLEELSNRPVSCFAYPHGHHESGTVAAVREAGFTSACTTASGVVSGQSDCLRLPRFQVLDWNADEFQAHLHAWQDGDG